MSNPLFNMMNATQYGDMSGLVKQFNQFKNSFHGDPKQQVQQLLNSGKVTQAQYDRAVQMANAFQNMLRCK